MQQVTEQNWQLLSITSYDEGTWKKLPLHLLFSRYVTVSDGASYFFAIIKFSLLAVFFHGYNEP